MKSFRHISLFIVLILLSLSIFTTSVEKEESGKRAFFGSENKSDEVLLVADWVVRRRDNHGMPFVIVDKKKQNSLYLTRKAGYSPLLRFFSALPVGDLTTPGVGNLKLSQIQPKDRTTSAGRFLLRHGFDLQGGKVLWIDFDAALAIHPVAAGASENSRLKRLKSSILGEHRITLGCVVVTKEFYRTVLSPLFDNANGYVYILPETMPVGSFFGIG